MHRTNITITDGLQTTLQAIADGSEESVAAAIERLLWDSPEVQKAAARLQISRSNRKRRGERGKTKNQEPGTKN